MEEVLSSSLVENLGWMLLHSLWQGLIVASLLSVVLLFLRHATAAPRYVVSCAALLVMGALPCGTFCWLAARSSGSSAHRAEAIEDGRRGPVPSTDAVAAHAPARPPARPGEGQTSRRFYRVLEAVEPFLPWLVLAWLGGVAMLSLRLLGGWILVERLKRRCLKPLPESWGQRLEGIRRRLGITGTVRCVQSTLVDLPTTIGWIRPVVLLPASVLTGLTPLQIEMILAHELAHVRRHDYLVNLVQSFVETLFFYNPAVWWLSRRIRRERENCCDDVAVSITDSRETYARTLMAMESLRSGGARLAMTVGRAGLRERILRVLRVPDRKSQRSLCWQAGLSVLLMVSVLTAVVFGYAAFDRDDSFTVARPGTERERRALDADHPRPEVAMRPLALRVVHSLTKEPLASVSLVTWGFGDLSSEERGPTDEEGRSRIEIPTGDLRSLTVHAAKPGYVPRSVTWWQKGEKVPGAGGADIRSAGIPSEYTLEMEPAASMGGVVLDEDGRGVRGANVYLTVLGGKPSGERVDVLEYPVKTDAQGRWRCDVLPSELEGLMIHLVHPGYLHQHDRAELPEILRKLRNHEDVRVMEKGLLLEGKVLDEQGRPLRNAAVVEGSPQLRLPTGLVLGPRATVRTDAGGRFRFQCCRPGTAHLTVHARGYAPELKWVDVASDAPPLEFRLGPGREIRGRIVDPRGRPVSGAWLRADAWRGARSLDRRETTDAEGRFIWRHAPPDVVFVDVVRRGYRGVRRYALQSSENDFLLTLKPDLRVRGRVVDAASGGPVPEFRVFRGFGNRDRIRWDRGNPRAFRDGVYDMTLSKPHSENWLRVEAAGFLPAVSRPLEDEGPQVFDFRLSRGSDLTGVVLSPEGQPLPDARVMLSIPSRPLSFQDGEPEVSDAVLDVATGPDGRFSLPPQDSPSIVVVQHALGYAEVPASKIVSSPSLTVEPWGRVEGALSLDESPVARATIRLWVGGTRASPGVTDVRHVFRTETSGDGTFVFDQVPPGEVRVAHEVKLESRRTALSRDLPVMVEPGRTARVSLGGGGRPVVGRLAGLGVGEGEGVDWTLADVRLKRREATGSRAAGLREASGAYAAPVRADGTFRVDGVAPGRYSVLVSAARRNQRGHPLPIGWQSLELEVPGPAGEAIRRPLELGTVELRILRIRKRGDLAPPFAVESLSGEPLRLEDYRGRHLLLYFWDSSPSFSSRWLPHLKGFHDSFGRDGRLAMVGINADADVETARRYVRENRISWPQGRRNRGEGSLLSEYGVQALPTFFLIDPAGRIVAGGPPWELRPSDLTRTLYDDRLLSFNRANGKAPEAR